MSHPAQPAATPAELRKVLLPLVGGAFLVVLNETILSVAVPSIMRDLDVSANTAQWVTSAYMLTMAAAIPASGFLLRRMGARQLFVVAMVLFSAGALMAALSYTFPLLVAARVVQACGAAVMMPVLMATVAAMVPPERRGTVMGTATIVVGAAPALGPATSGFGLSLVGWHGVFWTALGVALLILLLGLRSLPPRQAHEPVPIDWWSVALSLPAFGGIVLGLSLVESDVPAAIACLAAGLLVLAGFVRRQLHTARTGRAYLDLRTFRSAGFTAAIAAMAATSVILFATVSIVPLLMQNVLGVSTAVTGLAMLPGGAMIAILSPVTGRLHDRFGAPRVILPAACVVLAATVAFTQIPRSAGAAAFSAAFITLHIGFAGLFTPLMTLALSSVSREHQPDAGATFSTTQQLFGAAGAAGLIAIMQGMSTHGSEVTVRGVHGAFTAAAVSAAALLAITVWITLRTRRDRAAGEPDTRTRPVEPAAGG
ncbi:MFS transporter [Streptomyces sp. NPDC057340]|uniref:MFS transporter n=1 Tax=Streptomyces sp. NPDC057340 TaxID=3346103 RepID=UPI00363E537D